MNVISTLIDEVKFVVDSKGMSLKAVDPAHVAMIDLRMDAKAFKSYKADSAELGIDLDKVKEVLKLSSAGDIITMQHDEEHGRLIFKVGNITRRMNLVDTSSIMDVKMPALDLSASIEVPVAELQKGIKASETISDHISLVANKDSFELICEGDTDSADLKLEKKQLISVHVSSQVSSMFPLDYFANFIRAVPSDATVKVELDNDYPLKLIFDIADGTGSVTYLLAPRIENE